MPIDLLIKQCAPTLAGLKTGSMFPYRSADVNGPKREIKSLNKMLSGKGLRAIPLNMSGDRTLIYLYRPSSLKRDLKDSKAREVLSKAGYTAFDPARCIAKLIQKMKTENDFPHEVGLFLGYPPEDVEGFISNKATGYKLCGTWKVYGDEEKARKTFECYRSCKEDYLRRALKGCKLEDLVVSDKNVNLGPNDLQYK